jgi:hypothetical protein
MTVWIASESGEYRLFFFFLCVCLVMIEEGSKIARKMIEAAGECSTSFVGRRRCTKRYVKYFRAAFLQRKMGARKRYFKLPTNNQGESMYTHANTTPIRLSLNPRNDSQEFKRKSKGQERRKVFCSHKNQQFFVYFSFLQ